MQKSKKKINKKQTIENTKTAQQSASFWTKKIDEFIRKTYDMEAYPEDYSDEEHDKLVKEYNDLMGRLKLESNTLEKVKQDLLKLNNLKKNL
jgi:hypothetical protein